MNTKLPMAASAVIMGIAGMVLTFLPQESAVYLGRATDSVIVLQILGALYFGFAMVNWTAKGSLIGGIYSKPIAIGNFSHFLIGSLALIKFTLKNPHGIILAAAVIYSIFAILFGYIFYKHPGIKTKDKIITGKE